jgi:hypothetical protein
MIKISDSLEEDEKVKESTSYKQELEKSKQKFEGFSHNLQILLL